MLIALLLLVGVTGTCAAAEQPSNAPVALQQQAALPLPHAAEDLLLAGTTTGHAGGTRTVVVGDQGAVLLSDDGGKTFRQAKSVPTRVTLTAVAFADAHNGWACGQWGTIIHTSDGGETWNLQRSDTETDRPLFSIGFTDAQHGVAVGLWSLLVTTQDGGQSWTPVTLPTPPDGGKADRNLLGLFARGTDLYVAAERGMVLHSSDSGASWTYLNTGYKGSFWTGTALKDGSLLVAGLRGTIFRSDDAGKTWQAVVSGAKSSITGLVETPEGVVAVALDGVVLRSTDQGRTFRVSQRDDRMDLTAAVLSPQGKVIGLSRRGIVADLMPASLLK